MRKGKGLILATLLSVVSHVKAHDFKGEALKSADTVKHALEEYQWRVLRVPGTFEPAGWESEEAPALTRVQAVRMGLVVNEKLDERFDPFKGKRAALNYYGIEVDEKTMPHWSTTKGNILLADLAKETGLPLRVLENANPHLRRDVLPKGAWFYGVALDLEEVVVEELAAHQETYESELIAQYDRRRKQVLSFMPDPNTYEVITYTVRSGDYLGRISSKTGASVADIQKWNRLRGNTIYAGQKLTVWVPKSASKTIAAAVEAPKPAEEKKPVAVAAEKTEATPAMATLNTEDFILYRVKDGDTLWGIAQQFPGVSPDNIKSWNKVDELIKAGQQLKIDKQTISDYSPDKYPSTL